MSRVTARALLSLALAAGCKSSEPGVESAGETSAAGTSAALDTSTSTSEPTSTSNDTDGSTGSTTSVPSVLCGSDLFPQECVYPSICIVRLADDSGDVDGECVPNPDGCVPDYPCSPACLELCELYSLGVCSEQNADTHPMNLHCPRYIPCDPWNPDCPDGLKCAGTNNICAPIASDPAGLGEPCTWEPDNCEEGLFCAVSETEPPTGTCVAHCTGSKDMPECPPGFGCAGERCIPACDPLVPDCAEYEKCLLGPGDPRHFVCLSDTYGLGSGPLKPCKEFYDCDPGLFCGDSSLAVECAPDASGCCLSFCDLTDPTCPGVGQVCKPWYADPAPPGLEDVGFCALP